MVYVLGLNSEENIKREVVENFQGVGMIRGENLCISKMQYFTLQDFCTYVTNYLCLIAHIFPNHDVWYRTADLVPHQVNLLSGCDADIDPQNYLIGTKSVRRNLFNDDTKNTFICEIKAFMEAYKKNNNLCLLIPYLTNPEEYEEILKIVRGLGYFGKIGIMLEVPSTIIRIDEFDSLGVENYTLGVNDLTSCILGASRDIPIYSINNPAVLEMIKYTLKRVHSLGKPLTVAGYLNKTMVEFLKEIQVDKINIHYNDIPKIFDVENPLEYETQYLNIRNNYNNHKCV